MAAPLVEGAAEVAGPPVLATLLVGATLADGAPAVLLVARLADGGGALLPLADALTEACTEGAAEGTWVTAEVATAVTLAEGRAVALARVEAAGGAADAVAATLLEVADPIGGTVGSSGAGLHADRPPDEIAKLNSTKGDTD